MTTAIIKKSKVSSLSKIPEQIQVTKDKPFKDKELPSGGKLFKREHGIEIVLDSTSKSGEFTISYVNCKITALEIINGIPGDKVDFFVLDTTSGLVQLNNGVPAENIVPNAPINQFGFDVNIAKDYHLKKSEYDADLIYDMRLKVVYKSASVETPNRTVYINFELHEVK